MPCDYSKYPPNWKTEIRPRILERAGHKCEVEGCALENHSTAISLFSSKETLNWFSSLESASTERIQVNSKQMSNGEPMVHLDLKPVKVIITIAHLDHDPENFEVKDDRLKAMCQLHHLRYDAAHRKATENNR